MHVFSKVKQIYSKKFLNVRFQRPIYIVLSCYNALGYSADTVWLPLLLINVIKTPLDLLYIKRALTHGPQHQRYNKGALYK